MYCYKTLKNTLIIFIKNVEIQKVAKNIETFSIKVDVSYGVFLWNYELSKKFLRSLSFYPSLKVKSACYHVGMKLYRSLALFSIKSYTMIPAKFWRIPLRMRKVTNALERFTQILAEKIQ